MSNPPDSFDPIPIRRKRRFEDDFTPSVELAGLHLRLVFDEVNEARYQVLRLMERLKYYGEEINADSLTPVITQLDYILSKLK